MDFFVAPTIGFDLLYVLSSFDWLAETLSGSTSHLTEGARSRRHDSGKRRALLRR
jgi:hypothetical protein